MAHCKQIELREQLKVLRAKGLPVWRTFMMRNQCHLVAMMTSYYACPQDPFAFYRYARDNVRRYFQGRDPYKWRSWKRLDANKALPIYIPDRHNSTSPETTKPTAKLFTDDMLEGYEDCFVE